jgi:hypothetical protein
MKAMPEARVYKSRLNQITQTTPTCLWGDSASIEELTCSIEDGAVGATCNPLIVMEVLKKEMHLWEDRIRELIREGAMATEEQIGWEVVEDMSSKAASLLKPIFDRTRGKNGRLSIQTDPHLYRDSIAIVEQAVRFNQLAPNMIVKILVTPPSRHAPGACNDVPRVRLRVCQSSHGTSYPRVMVPSHVLTLAGISLPVNQVEVTFLVSV